MTDEEAVKRATRAADAANTRKEGTDAALVEAVRAAYVNGVHLAALVRITGRHRNTLAGWLEDYEPPGGKRKRSSSRRGSRG